MAKAWKVMFGDNEEERQREIQERIAVLEDERDKAGKKDAKSASAKATPGKKSYAVATAGSGETSTASPVDGAKGSAKRRKA